MIGVSSLDLLAHAVRHAGNDIVAVIDARRSEVYAARYGVTTEGVKRVMEPTVLRRPICSSNCVTRPTSLLVGDTLASNGALFARPSAETLVQIAPMYEPSAIEPLYLRKSDAELNADRSGA